MHRKLMQGIRVFGVFALAGGSAGSGVVGCLDRPVTSSAPTIQTNFTNEVTQTSIAKIDVLFDIDNSASMGDKQTYLIQAIPQMMARLLTPQCLDANQNVIPNVNAGPDGTCAMGTPEFPPVHDMHIGVVTSSLGGRGGNVCPSDSTISITTDDGATISRYNDDQGHLINRIPATSLDGGASDAAVPPGDLVDGGIPPLADPGLASSSLPEGGGFLSWFPSAGNTGETPVTPPQALTTSTQLAQDFSELIGGAGESGCGIESQLESWYRFLIQPDPYASIPTGTAQWTGVDTTIIQQRHDFLRPDSLVVVMVLSDENDSEIDVRQFGGTAGAFLDGPTGESSGYDPYRGTTACLTDPASPDCVVCPQALSGNVCAGAGTPAACTDPNCAGPNGPTYTALNDWGKDVNLRHVHMKQKYGLDPQYPLTRYFNGLTSATVPNRIGEYPSGAPSYVGTNNCVNPLFAGTLPQAADITDANDVTPGSIGTTLCQLQGTSVRTAADVFFAHIGGVPHQLLQSTPGDGVCPAGTAAGDCPQKPTLEPTDWRKILGQGPAAYASAVSQGTTATISYDYTGIDPHMIEAPAPRNGSLAPFPTPESSPPVSALSGPGLGTGTDPLRPDPINGREFITTSGNHSGLSVDREYACIFPLPVQNQRDCAAFDQNAINGYSCDCAPTPAGSTPNTPEERSPLCSLSSASNDYTLQTYAKAYPTTRELTLAAMMGEQGIVSSLCPIHPEDNAAQNDPLWGYRPAVNAIVDRLSTKLASQCLPPLTRDTSGNVPCIVLVSFRSGSPAPASSTDCASFPGGAFSNVSADILASFNHDQSQLPGGGLSSEVTCQLNQLPLPGADETVETCSGGTTPGWCYVTGSAVGSQSTCSQAVIYSNTSIVPNGATVNLQCFSTH